MPLVKPFPDPKPIINMSFKIPATPENVKMLKEINLMAAKDGWSVSAIIRAALEEYHERHSPGNPQLILGHWTEDLVMPKTVQRPKSKADLFEESVQRLVERAKARS